LNKLAGWYGRLDGDRANFATLGEPADQELVWWSLVPMWQRFTLAAKQHKTTYQRSRLRRPLEMSCCIDEPEDLPSARQIGNVPQIQAILAFDRVPRTSHSTC